MDRDRGYNVYILFYVVSFDENSVLLRIITIIVSLCLIEVYDCSTMSSGDCSKCKSFATGPSSIYNCLWCDNGCQTQQNCHAQVSVCPKANITSVSAHYCHLKIYKFLIFCSNPECTQRTLEEPEQSWPVNM